MQEKSLQSGGFVPALPPCHAFIPARYASTRFPGKPLAEIMGKPMFWHVWQRASRCPLLLSVTLATDDQRIAAAASSLGVPYVLTSSEHQSGTDRVYEAAQRLNVPDEAIIVNIQGDEPALNPEMLGDLVLPFVEPAVRVSTLAREIDRQEAASPDQVKVVRQINGDALYFSRSLIPYPRDETSQPCLGHIGLYAFRLEALKIFTLLPPSALEETEKLEQLRLLENGIPLRVVLTRHRSMGVDRPADLLEAEKILLAERSAGEY